MRMKQRVLTGIVGALLLLAVFMTFDTIFFNIAVLAAYFIALYEIYSAFKEQNVKALFLLLGIIGAYFVLLPYVPQVNNRLVIALLMGIYALITVASFDRIDFKTLSSSLCRLVCVGRLCLNNIFKEYSSHSRIRPGRVIPFYYECCRGLGQ